MATTIPTAYKANTYGLLGSSATRPPNGLVGQAIAGASAAPTAQSTNATATKAVGTGYDPTLSQVNAPTDTVQGQIQGIINANSPLMQQAETRANQRMNARGLLNSSMAVGAGQAALYDAALPIASADANVYNTTRLNNQSMQNTASQFGANADNTASLTNAQLGTSTSVSNAANKSDVAKFNASQAFDASKTNAALRTDVSKFNVDNAARLAIADLQNSADVAKFNASQSNDLIKLGMDSDTRTSLATIEANYKTLMQSSASASDMYKQAITSAAGILSNKDISDKARALNSITAQLNEGLNIIGEIANLDIGSYLDFSNTAPTRTTGGTAAPSTGGAVRVGVPAPEEPEKLPGESPFAYGARLDAWRRSVGLPPQSIDRSRIGVRDGAA